MVLCLKSVKQCGISHKHVARRKLKHNILGERMKYCTRIGELDFFLITALKKGSTTVQQHPFLSSHLKTKGEVISHNVDIRKPFSYTSHDYKGKIMFSPVSFEPCVADMELCSSVSGVLPPVPWAYMSFCRMKSTCASSCILALYFWHLMFLHAVMSLSLSGRWVRVLMVSSW